ncbi:MAG: hypothetical protein GXP26_03015 [Planctomycetes bacterium]|nr:hypothetical protein [Planctomycetota bacterium]
MRYFIASLALVLSAGMAGTALADEGGEQSAEATQAEAGTADAAVENKSDKKGKGRRGKGGNKGSRGKRDGHGPPKPEELFKKFDENKDGQLSLEEFMELSKAMRKHHARRGQGKGGKGAGKGGPRDGDRLGPPPLRNPGDRPGARDRGGPSEGHRMPDPNKVFDRFDKDGDGQLSREEFGDLAEAMREMRKRFGRREGKGPKGDRPGPPRRGPGPPIETE